MLDTAAINRMIEKQIATEVNDQVLAVLTSDEWVAGLEKKILRYTQDRILSKFANADSMPEIIAAVKNSVNDLFMQGTIPGIKEFVDDRAIQTAVNQAIEKHLDAIIEQICTNTQWLDQLTATVNRSVVEKTVQTLNQTDPRTVIRQRIDECMVEWRQTLLENFASTGIDDQATSCQLTIMDDNTVVENTLTAKNLNVMGTITVDNLIVKTGMNTDSPSWQRIQAGITSQVLAQVTEQWRQNLVDDVAVKIKELGIEFDRVKLNGAFVVDGGRLANSITESNLQQLGELKTLVVRGEARMNHNTFHVLNQRIGINTNEPEMALGIWDEEVSIAIGKHKNRQAYVGTSRDSSLALGTNRTAHVEIDIDGITTIKKLRLGLHRIGQESQVPGYSGVKGDLVFNTNPTGDGVFAWLCLGGHKWQVLKSA
jgi:hypothetical protein